MNPWAFLILGLLIGWLIEWIIDWLYWRRKTASACSDCRAKLTRLEQESAGLRAETLQLEKRLAAKEVELAELTSLMALSHGQVRDDLSQIKGVDATIAARLHDAGVSTFAELGALRPARLREIAGEGLEQNGSEVEIVRLARLQAGTLVKEDDLEVINGIGPVIAKLLNGAGIFTFADLAALTEADLREIVGDRIQRLANEGKILAHARLLAGR